ncbi:MAG: HAD family phosphatase [Streptomycetaceae bacterium]|nr:HAD family phosphatase [Streptomycetaceae bacterium]
MTSAAGPDASPLVVCDLDGTLLRSDATVSPYTRGALRRLIASGVALTIATARGVPSIRALLADVELPLPVVELGGAYVSDPDTGEHFVHHTLDRAVAVALVDALEAAGIEPAITSWDGTADHVNHGPLSTDGARWFHDEKAALNDPRLRYCADFRTLVRTHDIVLIRLSVPDEDADHAAELLDTVCGGRAQILAVSNGYCPGWTEFGAHGLLADKGHALRALRTRVGHTGPLMVCGDHLNDLPMFRHATAPADRRIAPANAHPDILALATDVTEPNDTDGIARFLLTELLPESAELAF